MKCINSDTARQIISHVLCNDLNGLDSYLPNDTTWLESLLRKNFTWFATRFWWLDYEFTTLFLTQKTSFLQLEFTIRQTSPLRRLAKESFKGPAKVFVKYSIQDWIDSAVKITEPEKHFEENRVNTACPADGVNEVGLQNKRHTFSSWFARYKYWISFIETSSELLAVVKIRLQKRRASSRTWSNRSPRK